MSILTKDLGHENTLHLTSTFEQVSSQRFGQNGQMSIKMWFNQINQIEWIRFSRIDHHDLTLSQIERYNLTLSQMNHTHLMT
jgi:hypothetical protein